MSISSVQGTSLGQDAEAWFRLRGGTIGRARDNDWVLPDPERIVSGHHARILYEQGGYYLEDTSSNGTYLNGQAEPLPRGQITELQHGDLIAIGDYEIRVELEEDATLAASGTSSDSDRWCDPMPQPAPAPEHPPDFIAKPYAPASHEPMMDNGGRIEADPRGANTDPTDDPWAAQRYPASTQAAPEEGWVGVQRDHLAPDAVSFRPPGAAPEQIPTEVGSDAPEEILPDDWWKIDEEPAEAPLPTSAPATLPEAMPQRQAERRMTPDAAAPEVQSPPAQKISESSDPVTHSDRAGVSDQRAAQPAQSPPAPPLAPPPQPAQEASTQAQPAPPPARPSPQAPRQVAEAPPQPAQDAGASDKAEPSAEVLIEAFFHGMGLSAPDLSEAETEALFRQTGRLMRMLADGLMDVLKTRSTLKSEFRLSQTIVQSTENNPLKFCVNADQALAQLFIDKRPGFTGPEASFGEALTDVKQHQLAVVAGMRAAFDCLLDKFDPATVEAARAAAGKKRSGLFADKQWDFYREYHSSFKANAGDDFRGIFGEDFVRAYEAQIQRLVSSDRED